MGRKPIAELLSKAFIITAPFHFKTQLSLVNLRKKAICMQQKLSGSQNRNSLYMHPIDTHEVATNSSINHPLYSECWCTITNSFPEGTEEIIKPVTLQKRIDYIILLQITVVFNNKGEKQDSRLFHRNITKITAFGL